MGTVSHARVSLPQTVLAVAQEAAAVATGRPVRAARKSDARSREKRLSSLSKCKSPRGLRGWSEQRGLGYGPRSPTLERACKDENCPRKRGPLW